MRVSTGLVVLTVGCLVPFTASADEPRQHDGGFFLRLAPAFGYASSTITDNVDEVKISGPAGAFDIALGAALSPNFIVHANVGAWAAVDPTLQINGIDFDTDDLTASIAMFGVGVTYYVGPSNVYLTGSIGLARLSAEFDNETSNTDLGFAVEAAVGKEWWVGRRWAIGVGGVINYHSVPDSDIDENWKGASFGVRLTATMN